LSSHDNIQRRAKCGARNNRIDVRPNWKEVPGSVDDWSANLHGEPDVLSAEAKLAARREALRMERTFLPRRRRGRRAAMSAVSA
jgi:hypothetical protein